MTRKHFIEMAAITRCISNDETRRYVATEQADLFASFNPRFDRQRYLTACGVV